MELGQKIGWAIVMLVPSLVGGILSHDYLGGWIATIIWVALMPFLYRGIISGKIADGWREFFA